MKNIKEWQVDMLKTGNDILNSTTGQGKLEKDGQQKGWFNQNLVRIIIYCMWLALLIVAMIYKWEGIIVLITCIFLLQIFNVIYMWVKRKWQNRKK